MQQGYAKLLKGPEAFTSILNAFGGVPGPHLMAWLKISVELLGGFAVLVGAFIPLASVPMATVLLVAMFSVHRQNGFSATKLIAITPKCTGVRFCWPRGLRYFSYCRSVPLR